MGYFGGAYDDDIECQESIPPLPNNHIEDLLIEEGIPDAGEEEECNDEDCEYCRQYYLHQLQMQ